MKRFFLTTLVIMIASLGAFAQQPQQSTKPTVVVVSTRSVLDDELKPLPPKKGEPRVAVILRTKEIADHWRQGKLTAEERVEVSNALDHALGRVGSPPCVAKEIREGRENFTDPDISIRAFVRRPAASACKD